MDQTDWQKAAVFPDHIMQANSMNKKLFLFYYISHWDEISSLWQYVLVDLS